jgi:biotin carboxyl carrier protein
MNRKVIALILLFISFALIAFVVNGQIRLRVLEKREQKEKITEEIQPRIVKEPPGNFFLNSPVESKYFENVFLDDYNPHLFSFFLDDKAPIKAVFTGRATKVLLNQKPPQAKLPFSEIWLQRDDGEFWANYIIFGEVFVKEGDNVSEGAVLANAEKIKPGDRAKTNFSFWLNDKNSELIRLTKEMFK